MPVFTRQLLWSAIAFTSYAASQSTSVIRVDDSPAFSEVNRHGIQYGPGWTQSSSQDSAKSYYQGTYTSTHKAGSYAMLSFQGTGVSYNADKGPSSGIALLAIDGEALPALNASSSTTQHQQTIFTISGLSPGDHQIVIGTQLGDDGGADAVGLDYFDVTSLDGNTSYYPRNLGPGAWPVPVNTIIVDDEDASIQYSEAWKSYQVNRTGPNPLFFNLTQHTTSVPGSSLSFTFHGTGVWYFSDDFPTNADVLISVDGAEADLVSTSSGASWVSQRLYWTRSGLSDGEHVVTVTHAGQQGQPANLDFFMYMPGSSTSGSSLGQHTNNRIGVIVGGVIGGIVGMGLVILALFVAYRRYIAASKNKPQATKTTEIGAHHLTLAKGKSRESQASFGEEKVGADFNKI